MKIVLTIFLFCLIPAEGVSETYLVPDDFPTIQKAISSPRIKQGDTIIVRPGTYVENIDFIGKAITVQSTDPRDIAVVRSTVIDGNQAGSTVVFMNGEGPESVLEGFFITNGSGTDFACSVEDRGGGGIFCEGASPRIAGNIISRNRIEWSYIYGGGICCHEESNPLIINNEISGNTADAMDRGIGGGIGCTENSSPIITGNRIFRNTIYGGVDLGMGGGIGCDLHSNPVITENMVIENRVLVCPCSSSRGGGIAASWKCTPYISNNTIERNFAAIGSGGGVFLSGGIIEKNIISGNRACSGGGICCGGFTSILSNTLYGNEAVRGTGGGIDCHGNAIIANNIISGNLAGGLEWSGGGGLCCGMYAHFLVNNTIFDNSDTRYGGGILCTGKTTLVITNSILWNNEAPRGKEIQVDGNSKDPIFLTISHSDVEGGKASVAIEPGNTVIWGPGMIDAPPRFVDAPENDFHLFHDSPCRNAGSGTAPGIQNLDFEGDPRIAGGYPDMGADEFYSHLYWTGDAVPGGNVKVKVVGLPGTSPVGLCLGSEVLYPPIPSIWGDWHLQFPIIGPMDLGSITSPEGVLIIPGVIPSSPSPPYSIPMQVLIGAELSNLAVLEVN